MPAASCQRNGIAARVRGHERMGVSAPENQAGARPMDEATLRGDIGGGVTCVAIALLGHFLLVPFGVYVPDSVAGTLDSPAVMPRIMFTALGLLGALLLGSGLRARASAIADPGRSAADWRKAFGMLAICAGYLAMIFVIGLPLASIISLIVALRYFGGHKWQVMLPIGILVPAVLWMFFVYVVHVSMPPALLELGQLNAIGIDAAWKAAV